MRRKTNLIELPEKKIAYVLGTFPLLTTTFIDREILEAKQQGLNLVLIAIRRPGQFEMRKEVKQLAEQTKYILPVDWLRFFGANLYFGLTRPKAYFSTLFYLISRQHNTFRARVKTILHFGEGIVAAALLRPERIDHIHAHFADRASVIALVASRLLGVSYSLTAHANDIYVSPVLLPEKVTNATFVATCTAYNKTHLERVTGRQVELVYHGLDLSTFVPVSHSTFGERPPLILAVGRLQKKKGFSTLIKACQLLKLQGYDFRCEIVGKGPLQKELETLITELELDDTVTLSGPLPNKDVMTKYSQATLFTLPSVIANDGDRDGIPNVILEAMAMRLPVVSTRVSGIPEVVKEGVTGLLVSPGDEKALASALATLLDNVELRQRLGKEGRCFVERHFDIDANIGRLVDLFAGSML